MMEENKKIKNLSLTQEEKYLRKSKIAYCGSLLLSGIIILNSKFGFLENTYDKVKTSLKPSKTIEENDPNTMVLSAEEVSSLAEIAYDNNVIILNNTGYTKADLEDVISIVNNGVPMDNESDIIDEPFEAEVFFNDLATDSMNSRLEEQGIFEVQGESGLRFFKYQDIVNPGVNDFFTELDTDYNNVLSGNMNRDEFIAKYYKVALGEDEEQFLFRKSGTPGVELSYFYAISQAFTDILMEDPNASIPASLVYKDLNNGEVIFVSQMFGYLVENEMGEMVPYISENGNYPMEYATTLEAIRRTAIQTMITDYTNAECKTLVRK